LLLRVLGCCSPLSRLGTLLDGLGHVERILIDFPISEGELELSFVEHRESFLFKELLLLEKVSTAFRL